jgi:hypothetical protein
MLSSSVVDEVLRRSVGIFRVLWSSSVVGDWRRLLSGFSSAVGGLRSLLSEVSSVVGDGGRLTSEVASVVGNGGRLMSWSSSVVGGLRRGQRLEDLAHEDTGCGLRKNML